MGVELVEAPEMWHLTLSGVVGIAEAQQLSAAARTIADRAGKDVVVRSGDLRALDTAAVQILVALKRALMDQGRSLRLEQAPPAIVERLRRAGLEKALGSA